MAIATAYIWAVGKDDISAPLRNILIHWRLQNINTYVLHLSKEPFSKNVSDLEVVKTARISLLYADFNVWKKVGNYCCVQDDTVL